MKLCVALDMPSKEDNIILVDDITAACKNLNISTKDIWLKIGLRSYIRDGRELLYALQDKSYRIFLDLKLYDIPNTMLDSIIECEKLDIDMLTIHASCGFKAMQAIANLLQEKEFNMLIMAVSVLTSFDSNGFREVYSIEIKECVKNLAILTHKSGLSGLVCAIDEVSIIKNISPSLLTVTPGIRLESTTNPSDDQQRVATLQDAKMACSDFVVIGRPIYRANNRIYTLESILQKIYKDQ